MYIKNHFILEETTDGDSGGGAPASVTDRVSPTVSSDTGNPQTDTSDRTSFNAKYDRESLLSNAPEGVDKEAFGKWLDKTQDPYASFKNYSNIERMKSKGLPNESWTDEDYASLNRALGVPDSEDGYEFSEDIKIDEDSAKFVKSLAKQMDLPKGKADVLAKTLSDIREQESILKQKEEDDNIQNVINFLQDEWGHPDTKAYRENFDLVSDLLQQNGINPDSKASEKIWSGPPQVIKMLSDAAKMMSPSDLPRVKSGDLETPKSIEEKIQRVAAQMNNRNLSPSERSELDSEFDRLYKHKQRISR